MTEDYVIGFDVGGTRVKSGAVTRSGTFVSSGVQPSGFLMDPHAFIEVVKGELRRIVQETRRIPKGIGLGFSGAVDPEVGVVLLPGKLKGFEGFPIVQTLRDLTQLPVIADNDGRLSIYAERFYGKAQHHEWAVTITIGTGLGSGVLLDGKILRDPHLQFGTQMGHTVLQAQNGRLCITGARGTAEMFCSATALTMAVREGLQRGIPSTLSDTYFEDPTSVDFQTIIEAVEAGDVLCQDELRHWTTNLGWLLVSTVHAYAPEVIILSGGATNAAEYFLEPLRTHVNQHLFRYPKGEPVEIVLSEILDHAGVLGGAALAWEYVDASTQ